MTIRGIAFPFNRSFPGFPASSQDEETIADNIERIIQTRRGYRVMRPDSGSDTYSFIFENSGALLRARIDNEIKRAIAAGEPRARVLSVNVTPRETENGIENLVEVVFEALGTIQRAQATI